MYACVCPSVIIIKFLLRGECSGVVYTSAKEFNFIFFLKIKYQTTTVYSALIIMRTSSQYCIYMYIQVMPSCLHCKNEILVLFLYLFTEVSKVCVCVCICTMYYACVCNGIKCTCAYNVVIGFECMLMTCACKK